LKFQLLHVNGFTVDILDTVRCFQVCAAGFANVVELTLIICCC